MDFALNTLAMTTIAIIGGANANLTNARNRELFTAIGCRAFDAMLEGGCLEAPP